MIGTKGQMAIPYTQGNKYKGIHYGELYLQPTWQPLPFAIAVHI